MEIKKFFELYKFGLAAYYNKIISLLNDSTCPTAAPGPTNIYQKIFNNYLIKNIYI